MNAHQTHNNTLPALPPSWTSQSWKVQVASLLLCVLGAIFDFMTPLGVAGGIIYVLFVLSAIWFYWVHTAFVFALIATTLTIIGYFVIAEIETFLWVAQLNRGLSILALWTVALIIYSYQKATQGKLLASQGDLLASSSRLHAVMETVVDGIITISEKGTIQSFNSSAERIFGYTVKDVIGQNVKILMPKPYHDEHDGYLQNYLTTGDKKVIGIGREVEAKRKDGSIFSMELAVSEIEVDNEHLFVGSIRDITERKKVEQEREKLVEQLTTSNKELDDFAYIAAHDLKEPLRAIHNHSSFLLEDYEDKLDEDGVKKLNRLIFLTKRMEKLISDLMYFSRLGREEISIRETDINEVIHDIDEVLHDTLIEMNVVIHIPKPLPTIICNKVRISEMFRNLITNAVKYNDNKEKKIEIGFKNSNNGVFYVQDNGIGIEKEFHEDVFRIFKCLNSEREYGEGSGSGLTFVKKIVERHGGKIWIESEKGKGTTFYFTLNGEKA